MPDFAPRVFALGITSSGPEERTAAEMRWVSYQPYLLSKGYQLRPRYRKGWVPSWRTNGKWPYECEDRPDTLALNILDATRISDNQQVAIKILSPSPEDRNGLEEVEILKYFSSDERKSDPDNHVLPCLDTFPVPDIPNGTFIVTPLLVDYNYPPFWDLGEIQDFIDQIFEGLEYLHKHNVAHCDIASPNIMLDVQPLFTEPFHPYHEFKALDSRTPLYPRYVRSQKPVRYYYIDFGYSKRFKEGEQKIVSGWKAREQAPEQVEGEPYDPFKADIYQLGAILRRDLIPSNTTLSFLLPIARQMTEEEPSKRPSLVAARRTINTEFGGLSGWRRRWPIIRPDASTKQRIIFYWIGIRSEIVHILQNAFRLLMGCQ